MKKILFVSQDASLTGAPLVLFEILKRLQNAKKYYIKVLFLKGGEMLEDFDLLCETEVLERKSSIFKKVSHKIFKKNDLIHRLNKEEFDLLYLNSIASFVFFPELELLKVNKTILHLHESRNFTNYTSKIILDKVVKKADKIICVSSLVKKHLVSLIEVDLNKLVVIYPYFYGQNLTEKKKINKDSFVIGGCGNYNSIKGLDLFVIIASKFFKIYGKNHSVQFIWLGDNGSKEAKYLIQNDIKKLELEREITILPKTKTPLDIFQNFDLFFLSAREEAFGLAAFENGKLGNPIICFKDSSGVSELIESNNTILPYLDIDKAVQLIWELFNNRKLLQAESEQIRKSFTQALEKDDLKNIEKLISELIF